MPKKETYYDVFQDNEDEFGLAHPPKGIDVYLANQGRVRSWKSFELTVKDGLAADYLNNTLICRICSESMRELLTQEAGERDQLQWLPVTARDANGVRPYFILHFLDPPDVLDRRDSIIMYKDHVVKPVLSRPLCVGHRVFSFKHAGVLTLLVNQDVIAKLTAAKLTGMIIDKAAIRD